VVRERPPLLPSHEQATFGPDAFFSRPRNGARNPTSALRRRVAVTLRFAKDHLKGQKNSLLRTDAGALGGGLASARYRSAAAVELPRGAECERPPELASAYYKRCLRATVRPDTLRCEGVVRAAPADRQRRNRCPPATCLRGRSRRPVPSFLPASRGSFPPPCSR